MKRDKSVEWRHVELQSLNLEGSKAAVIGGTNGLGRALSLSLASRGAGVVVVGRTFRDAGVRGLEFMQADLSLMNDARRIAKALPAESLDLLVFTNGIFAAPKRQETAEGLERDMAVSYLSRIVILRDVAGRMGTSRPAGRPKPRVFIMGFPGSGQTGATDDLNADKSYSAMRVHMNTVAGNEALVLDAAARYPNLSTFGLNPGLIRTTIRDNFLGEGSLKSRVSEFLIGLFTPAPQAYADHLAPLFVAPELETRSGAMFDQKGNAILPSPKLTDVSHRGALLAASEALLSRVQPAA